MSSSPLTLPALELRHDWSTAEIQSLLELPLMDLLWVPRRCTGKPILATGCSLRRC